MEIPRSKACLTLLHHLLLCALSHHSPSMWKFCFSPRGQRLQDNHPPPPASQVASKALLSIHLCFHLFTHYFLSIHSARHCATCYLSYFLTLNIQNLACRVWPRLTPLSLAVAAPAPRDTPPLAACIFPATCQNTSLVRND